MDLPPRRTSTGSSGAGSAGTTFGTPTRAPAQSSTSVHRDSSVKQASATSEEANPYPSRQFKADKSADNASRYGHAGDHGWLKGKLEYSQAHHRWKLRYIPIDGQTDQYGGSVILRKSSLLSGFERGDYVEVNGRLVENSAASDYAPEYELTQIRRIAK
ncbi:MAG: hypothetical protein JXM70_00875 [Pirellulales bacterium]|nr:hypothetical protein [Pirellulales bacterium]